MILSLVALAVVGCNKAGTSETGPASEPMVFSASTVQTKAVFASGDDGTLEWSSYDNLGVYSFDGVSLVHNGFAAMKNFTGSEAVFTSSDSRAAWAGAASNLTFYAYYPQLLAPEASYSTGRGTVALTVPTAQNGEFGRYHICYATTDITADALTAGEPVNFEFAPKTSMIRVRPVLSADSDVDQVAIKQVVISIADNKTLVGDCEMALSTGNLSFGSGASVVSVTLPTAAVITKTVSSNPFFTAILLPATSNNSVLSFYAVASDGTRLTMANKLSPTTFVAGTRYSIDREVTVLITADGTPDGQYIDGGYAWAAGEVVEDGAYTDGGMAW